MAEAHSRREALIAQLLDEADLVSRRVGELGPELDATATKLRDTVAALDGVTERYRAELIRHTLEGKRLTAEHIYKSATGAAAEVVGEVRASIREAVQAAIGQDMLPDIREMRAEIKQVRRAAARHGLVHWLTHALTALVSFVAGAATITAWLSAR